MLKVFKYNIFPHINYIEMRNFIQCVKQTYFEGTSYAFDVINIADNELITHLHFLTLKRSLHHTTFDILIPTITEANIRFGDVYKEIYGKTMKKLIESYTDLPSFVIKDKFFDEMVQRCVNNIAGYCFETGKYHIPSHPFTLALVSDDSDINDHENGEFEDAKIKVSKECLRYANLFEQYGYLLIF